MKALLILTIAVLVGLSNAFYVNRFNYGAMPSYGLYSPPPFGGIYNPSPYGGIYNPPPFGGLYSSPFSSPLYSSPPYGGLYNMYGSSYPTYGGFGYGRATVSGGNRAVGVGLRG